MEEKRLLSKDEVYFLVFFSNSFIGSIILSGRYHFDFTMAFDREVPLLPVFVWLYMLERIPFHLLCFS